MCHKALTGKSIDLKIRIIPAMDWVIASAVLPGSYQGAPTSPNGQTHLWQRGRSKAKLGSQATGQGGDRWGYPASDTGWWPPGRSIAIRQVQGQARKSIYMLESRSPRSIRPWHRHGWAGDQHSTDGVREVSEGPGLSLNGLLGP